MRDKNFAFLWGYGHFIIFGSAAAIGALVSVNVDVLTNHASVELGIANFGFSVAVALYLFGLWFCQEKILAKDALQSSFLPVVAACTFALGLLPYSIFTIGLLIVVAVIYRQYKPLQMIKG